MFRNKLDRRNAVRLSIVNRQFRLQRILQSDQITVPDLNHPT